MKTSLITLFALSSGLALGQIPATNPLLTHAQITARTGQYHSRVRQPTPPPIGFWVVEENVGRPAIIHFYADNRQVIRTDTLRQKHLNLKRRVVVGRLNRQLNSLFDAQPVPASVAGLRP
ncbi:hypothetical protein [Spirosoma luteum]|uniref:hypothetical protein n=1 Tax=Spirosoma luteum TaxID=431553 RepID=UPI00036D8EA5|nr:hypothetical protein [Spirosoma luteum]